MAGLLAELVVFTALALLLVSMLDPDRDGEDVGAFIMLGMWFAYLIHADTVLNAAWLDVARVPLPREPMIALGCAIIAVGLVVFLWSSWTLARDGAFAGLTSTKLVTRGPYRHVRNPQDLGWALMLTGVAVGGRSLIAVALVGVFAVFVHYIWRADARQLERRFGDAYGAYRAVTPAIVPARRPPLAHSS